jgi:glutamate:GABA antiporter
MRAVPAPGLRRVLGLWDIVAMNIVAVVGLRWIGRSARLGAPSVTLWVLAWMAFFLPLTAAIVELSSRHPESGGIYAWVRRAFGPRHGFLCGWCVWVNNLFYFPSLLLFAAANALLVFGPPAAGLADSRAYSVGFVLVVLWACVALNILGLGAGRWLQTLGSVSTWVPAALLMVAGAVAFVTRGSATSFAPSALIPHGALAGTLNLGSAMCFAFSGFEIGAFVGGEVRDPRRTLPRAILISGAVVTLIYIAGSASVLVALPASALQERSGIADAVTLAAAPLGLAGLGALTGGLIAIGSIAGNNSWFGGAARVPFAAGVDRALPPAFARLHPTHHTPIVAILTQGVLATAIFLISVFLSVTGGKTSVQEAYDILVNLTILVYFVPYLYLFPALVRLRPPAGAAEDPAVVRVPGGAVGLWTAATVGFLATAISVGLVFLPPEGTTNILNYEANLIGQAAVVIGAGYVLYRFVRRSDDAGLSGA